MENPMDLALFTTMIRLSTLACFPMACRKAMGSKFGTIRPTTKASGQEEDRMVSEGIIKKEKVAFSVYGSRELDMCHL